MEFTESMGNVLKLLGYEGETFHLTRSRSINESETAQTILAEAPYFGEEVTTKRLCEVHGMIDSFPDIQAKKLTEMQERIPMMQNSSGGAEDDNGANNQTE